MKNMHLEDIKKISLHFAAVLAMALAVICSGCANFADDTAYVVKKTELSSHYNLTMNVVSDDGFMLFKYASQESSENASRTIIPDYDASDFKYYLIYKEMLGGTSWQIEKNIAFNPTSKNTGTITKTFAPSYYAFYLYAITPERAQTWEDANITTINESTLINYASLKAHTYIDLTNTDTLTFHLKTNDYSSGKGGFSVLINHINEWAVDTSYRITVGLYDIGTNNLVYPAEPKIIKPNGAEGGGTVKNYMFESSTAYSISTGTYSFSVTYEHYDNGIKISECSYSERISILMNLTSVGEMNIPYFLDEAPKAPSCFIAGYKLPENSDSGYYETQFAWSDNSYTEQYFKLQLIEIKGDSLITTPTNDNDWNLLQGWYGTSSTMAGLSVTGTASAYTEKGTLYKNTNSLILNIPLGKRYVARICATNSVGDSAWAYLNLPQTSTYIDPNDNTKSSELDADFLCFSENTQTINLHRISYLLGDGIFKAFDEHGNETDIPALVTYESQKNISTDSALGIELLSPDGLTENSYLAEDGLTKVSNAKLTLSNAFGNWHCWQEIAYTESYVQSGPDFITGINYYEYDSDSSSYSKLAVQPTSADDCSSFFIRKVALPKNTGYENISYIAEYDEVSIDLSEYEIEGKSLSLMFMKNGAWTSEIAPGSTYIDSDGDGYITFADSPSDSILTISASSVDSIYFTQNDNGTYDYSDMYLTIKKANGKSSVIMNNQRFNTLKQWELYLGNLEKGYYLLNFSATVQISGANVTMPYAFILNLTD